MNIPFLYKGFQALSIQFMGIYPIKHNAFIFVFLK